MDDQLWPQAISLVRYIEEFHHGRRLEDSSNLHLFNLIQRGLVDPETEDKMSEATTRAMRYIGIVGKRLWAMIEGEKARVSPSTTPLCGVGLTDFIG